MVSTRFHPEMFHRPLARNPSDSVQAFRQFVSPSFFNFFYYYYSSFCSREWNIAKIKNGKKRSVFPPGSCLQSRTLLFGSFYFSTLPLDDGMNPFLREGGTCPYRDPYLSLKRSRFCFESIKRFTSWWTVHDLFVTVGP